MWEQRFCSLHATHEARHTSTIHQHRVSPLVVQHLPGGNIDNSVLDECEYDLWEVCGLWLLYNFWYIEWGGVSVPFPFTNPIFY
jgi:hypothetical protein